MNYLAKISLGTISFLSVLMPSTALLAREAVTVNLPKKSNMTCQASIASVRGYLVKNGYFSPKPTKGFSGEVLQSKIQIDKNRIRTYYFDYPVDRPEVVDIHLTGNANKIFDGFKKSPKQMANLVGQIIAQCDRVGMVTFTAPWEEFYRPFGYFPDNTVRNFTWVEERDETEIKTGKYPYVRLSSSQNGPRYLYKWGYSYSP